MATRLTISFPPADHLQQRWPDVTLSKTFRELLHVYEGLVKERLDRIGNRQAAVNSGYKLICKWARESLLKPHDLLESKDRGCKRLIVSSLVARIRRAYGDDWLQALASLFGMLMHFSADAVDSRLLNNKRRPQKLFSTYPNSPALARFVADIAVANMYKLPVPVVCQRATDAEGYAERALNFRVLDPSMESGQLLIEFAARSIRRVLAQHLPGSKTALRLIEALLGKLCRDCLWGIDRNELAADATRTLFSLLCTEFGVSNLLPQKLLRANALESFAQGKLPKFDCVINNPPWGEALSPEDRSYLRGNFFTLSKKPDTYIAFSELVLRCLRPGGSFVLILPSQVIGTSNTLRLRKLIAESTELDQMVLLPRAAFAEATVRSVVLAGRVRPARPRANCRVIVYPLVKRFDTTLTANSHAVATSALRGTEADCLSFLIRPVRPLEQVGANAIRLEHLASVITGVRLYGVGRGYPPQTVETVRERSFTFGKPKPGTMPAIRGRDVRDFKVGKPSSFIKFGVCLAGPGKHRSLRHRTRIFLRELCHRDGKLTAAVTDNGLIPLHGVLTVIPESIDAHVLVSILNSTAAADYVRHYTASFTKVDFQKITVGELRRMPITPIAVNDKYREKVGFASLTKHEAELRERLASLARALSMGTFDNESAELRAKSEINEIVMAMYQYCGGMC